MTERGRPLRPLPPAAGHVLGIVRALPRPALLTDGDGRVAGVNAAACELFGVDEDALLDAPFAALVSPGAPDEAGAVPAMAHRNRAADLPVRLGTAEIAVRGGVVVLHTLTDVSEELRTRQTLGERDRTLREHFEHARDIVYSHDFAGNFTQVNPAGLRLYGYSLEEMLGANVAQIIDPAHMETARQAVARQLKDPAAAEPFELLTHARDGRDIWLEVNLRVITEGGRPMGIQGIARDTTERRATEAALRASEARLAGIVAAAPFALIATDGDGVFTLFEGRAVEKLGLRPNEFLGRSAFEVCAAYPEVIANLRRVLAGESFAAVADIGGIAFEVHHAPVRDASGAVVGMLGVGIDATARVEAERALAQSREQLHAVAASAPLMLAAFDRAGVITVCEGRFTRSFRRGADEIVGQQVRDLFRDRPEALELVDRALRGEDVVERLTLAGREVEGTLIPMRDAAGAVTGVTVLAFDISDRVHAEQALLNALEFQQLVMESTRDAIVATDRDGRIVLVNRRACELTGRRREELIGHHVRGVLSAGTVLAVRDATDAAIDTGRAVGAIMAELERPDGVRVQVALTVAPLMERGEVVGVVGTAEDVSERLRTERQLATQRQLLEMIAVGEPLGSVLQELVEAIEQQAPGALCSVLLLDRQGLLRHGAAPSLPDDYNRQIDGVAIGPAVGSCGTAAYRNETVIVTDIATDPLWDGFREIALAHGLRACWSTPIASGDGEVLGTFAVYYREPRAPDDGDRELIRIATHAAGIALERRRAEEAAAGHTAQLERLYADLVDAHADLATANDRLQEKSLLLERALEAERERGRRDPLTGALNHAAIAEVLRDVVARSDAGSVGVAMVDVDGLKAANDTYGHPVGDAVLLAVARALNTANAVVGRYGGDEFVAVLPGTDRAGAEAYRAGVLEALSQARVIEPETGTLIPVVASIGVAIYPEEAAAVEDLIRLADNAMYASRRLRAFEGEPGPLGRSLGPDRAERMVAEILPLLTSPGHLGDKLRLVSHRLSVGAGYDGVTFALIDAELAAGTHALTRAAGGLNERVAGLLRSRRRPIIIDDLARDGRLAPDEQAALHAPGMRAALLAPMLWQDDLIGALSVGSKRPAAFTARDAEFVAAVATQVTAIVRMASMLDQLQASSARLMRAHTETVLMLAGAAEAHDHGTGRHLQRVRGLAEALARELGKSEEEARDLGLAAVLHDIGKIRVPDIVLGSSATLAESEWVLMKQHTIWGSEFLAGQQGFALAAEVAHWHHERWDGTGYPDGLAGEAIPESAQITAVADAFDAMTNDRPYRLGRPIDDAVAELVRCSGTQFSPRVVAALARLHERGALAFVQRDATAAEERAA